MALQREVSPIPPGRYWILVEGRDIPDFDDWLRDMHGAARVEVASLDQGSDLNRGVTASQFIIFRVPEGRMPFLNAHQFGFPSFAPPNITSRDDVIQTELVKNPEDVAVDVIRKAGASAEKAAEGFGGLLVIALLLLAMGGAGALAHR
jgi:hypothetical protein